MSGSKSKAKESRHISQVIPILDRWWGASFKKTPASGALRWNSGHWIWGDIVPPEDLFLAIECKSHLEFDVDEIIRKGWQHGKITWYWYDQTIGYATAASKVLGRAVYPALIFKENQNVSRLVLQHSLFSLLPKDTTRTFPHLIAEVPEGTPFVICDLKTFCERVDKPAMLSLLGGSDDGHRQRGNADGGRAAAGSDGEQTLP